MTLLSQEDQLLLINKMTDEYQTIIANQNDSPEFLNNGYKLLVEINQLTKPRYFDEYNLVALQRIGFRLANFLHRFSYKFAS